MNQPLRVKMSGALRAFMLWALAPVISLECGVTRHRLHFNTSVIVFFIRSGPFVIRLLQAQLDYFFPLLPAAMLVVIDAVLFARFGSDESVLAVATFVIVVFPLTITLTTS